MVRTGGEKPSDTKSKRPLARALKSFNVFLQEDTANEDEKENVVRTPEAPRAGQLSPDDVNYLTNDAVDKSVKFPTASLNSLLHQEAQNYLECDDVQNAALTLLQFQSTSIRHQALYQCHKRMRNSTNKEVRKKANAEKKLPTNLDIAISDLDLDRLEKDILDFRSTRDEGGRDLLRNIGKDLPPEWKIVQLTVDCNGGAAAGGRFKRELKDEPIVGGNFGLLVVTANCGQPDAPDGQALNVVRVPAVPCANKMPTITKELQDTLYLHMRMYRADQVADKTSPQDVASTPRETEKSKKEKGYKALKNEVDARLSSLMTTVEDTWLGFAKVLLLGHPVLGDGRVRDGHVRKTRLDNALNELQNEFFTSDPQFVSSGRHHLLSKLLDGAAHLNPEQMRQGLLCVLDGCDTRLNEVEQAVDEFLCPETGEVHRHPVVLILDKQIQQLPWESMKCLQKPPQPMSRVPSAAFLCALNAAHKKSKTSVSRTGVRQDKIFYVLNPDKNLANTQKRLEGQLEALGGEGKVGEHPSLPEMKRVLEGMDAFMYMGHGSSLRTMPSSEIEKLRVRAMPLLFGCRSGQMSRMGRSLDPVGPACSYLIASAPCILGFLWGVTDRDVDLWTVAFLKHWLSTGQEGQAREKEFVKAVAEQRHKFQRFVNSAATVVYGLPSIATD